VTTFSDLESSAESSRPVELYVFALGATSYLYTNSQDEITVGADVYLPTSISRDAIAQGSDERNRVLTVTMPGDNTFARKYVDVVPGNRAVLSIYRLQRDESPGPTPVLAWKGIIKSVRFPDNGQTAQVAAQSLDAALSHKIPRYSYKSLCNHVLYGAGCLVDPTAFSVTGLCSSIAGSTVVMVGADSQPDGYWKGGIIRPVSGTDFRLVLDHVGTTLTLLLPFADDPTGANLQVYAGCNHRLVSGGDCLVKFDNVARYGGFGYVPNRNIYTNGVL
jgi:uncharacterized phage protein (TIGR02218 family)